MKNRKALSPLIATILLVVVAVILITIVLTWGKNFTNEGLSKATNVVDESCSGASIYISDCSVDSDGNIIFYVKNTSSTYTFTDSDNFTVDFKDSSDNFSSGNTLYPDAGELSPGEVAQADMNISALSITGTYIDVTVKSSVCPNEASATYLKCH